MENEQQKLERVFHSAPLSSVSNGVTELSVNVLPINGIIPLCAVVYHRDTCQTCRFGANLTSALLARQHTQGE